MPAISGIARYRKSAPVLGAKKSPKLLTRLGLF